MKYVLGIDFGGGSSKATLLSENGDIAAVNSVEYPTLYPKDGYVEQNPSDWYNATKENIAGILKKSGVQPADICALCLDAATHTAVLTDENFNVLCPSVYWTDIRSVEEVEYLKKNYGQLISKQVLHNPGTIWTLPQLLWMKKNKPEIWKNVKKIMFAKDYVRHMITGDYLTDYIEAQGSMMFDFNTLSWSRELCSILEFDVENLPEVVSPTDIAGTVTKKAADELGLMEGTKVLVGTTDTALEVFASGAVKKGDTTIKLATAGRICTITDKFYPDEHIINYSHIIKGLCYPGTATKACASSYRWYRDTFGGDYKSLDGGAENVPIGCGGLMFHPYLNGELTPYGDPNLCASYVGVRAFHTKAHFTRAVLEGVAFSLLDCKEYLYSAGIPLGDKATIIGGGSSSPLWRQIVADVLNITLVQNENSDSSLGSAILAGVSAGLFESCEAGVSKCTKQISVTCPNPENTKKYMDIFKKYKAVHDALKPIYDK